MAENQDLDLLCKIKKILTLADILQGEVSISDDSRDCIQKFGAIFLEQSALGFISGLHDNSAHLPYTRFQQLFSKGLPTTAENYGKVRADLLTAAVQAHHQDEKQDATITKSWVYRLIAAAVFFALAAFTLFICQDCSHPIAKYSGILFIIPGLICIGTSLTYKTNKGRPLITYPIPGSKNSLIEPKNR